MSTAPRPALHDLPADLGRQFADIARSARTVLRGRRATQYVFDRHVGFFDALLGDGGVTHDDLARLLAEAGVCRCDGTPLTRGTVSAALCRARERAAAQAALPAALPAAAMQAAATPAAAAAGHGMPRRRAATSGSALQQPAEAVTAAAAADRRRRPSGGGGKPAAKRSQPPPPAAAEPGAEQPLLAAANLLNDIRSKP
jgi:hypothetical protein